MIISMARLLTAFTVLIALSSLPTDSRALPPCPEDPNATYDNCFGTYTYADGDTYVGEFKDDKRNGQGTSTLTNGDTYFGEYKDGEFQGQGAQLKILTTWKTLY